MCKAIMTKKKLWHRGEKASNCGLKEKGLGSALCKLHIG